MSGATNDSPMAAPGEFGIPRVLNSKNRLILSQNIGANKWEALATELDFPPAKIATFKAANPGDPEAQIRNMLTEWVQREAGNPIVQMLVGAFRKTTVNLKTLANALEEAAQNDADIVCLR